MGSGNTAVFCGKSMLFVCSSMEVQRSVCWRWNSMADRERKIKGGSSNGSLKFDDLSYVFSFKLQI